MIKSFFISFFSFLALDFLWLGFVMKKFNLEQLAELGRIQNGNFQIQYGAASVVYILLPSAVTFFVLPKLNADSNLMTTFLWGAFMGLIIYGVYDMTNLSVLKNYPLAFSVADLAWGTFVFGLVSALTWKIASY
jgi:uncharacterized membrane protein